jgi:hypothetical protein
LDNLGTIAWKALFGDDFETSLDINKPEESATVNAMNKAKREDFKKFAEGYGKVLFDQLQSDIRMGMFDLLTKDTICNDGHCLTTRKIEQMQHTLKIITKAFSIISVN